MRSPPDGPRSMRCCPAAAGRGGADRNAAARRWRRRAAPAVADAGAVGPGQRQHRRDRRPALSPYAPAWQAAGLRHAALQVIDAKPRDALWAAEQCLRSGACAAVLCWPQQRRRSRAAPPAGGRRNRAMPGLRVPPAPGRAQSLARARCASPSTPRRAAARAQVPRRAGAARAHCLRTSGSEAAAMRWACLLLPQLALDGVLRRQPMPDAPLALIDGPVQRRVLHSVNPAARALGLRPGQSLAAAQALSNAVSPASTTTRRTRRTGASLLAAWAYRFSSQVSTQFPHAIVLEIGPQPAAVRAVAAARSALREELRELGFRHRMVAAPNPHAARVLANVHDGLALTDEHACCTGLGQIAARAHRLPRDRGHHAVAHGPAQPAPGVRAAARQPGAALSEPGAAASRCACAATRPLPLALYRPPDVSTSASSSTTMSNPARRCCSRCAA